MKKKKKDGGGNMRLKFQDRLKMEKGFDTRYLLEQDEKRKGYGIAARYEIS